MLTLISNAWMSFSLKRFGWTRWLYCSEANMTVWQCGPLIVELVTKTAE